MGKEVVGSATLDDFSFLHHHDSVGHIVDNAQIVGDEEVGEPILLFEVVQKVKDLCLNTDIEGGDALIAYHQFRL